MQRVSAPNVQRVVSTSLPRAFHTYFWDISLKQINVQKHSKYIIERIMTWGDETACRWMHKTFSLESIRETLKTSRNLDKKTAVFFSYIYDVSQKEVRCLQKQSPPRPSAFWPY